MKGDRDEVRGTLATHRDEESTPFERLVDFARRIVAVPKTEALRHRRAKKRLRHPRPAT